jgi:hypothetical protein
LGEACGEFHVVVAGCFCSLGLLSARETVAFISAAKVAMRHEWVNAETRLTITTGVK